jgi:hypothetical protein
VRAPPVIGARLWRGGVCALTLWPHAPAQAGGPLRVEDVGVVFALGGEGSTHVSRLAPCGDAAAYDAAALVPAATFPAAGRELVTGALVRLAHGYVACHDAEDGPLSFTDVGIVMVGCAALQSRVRVACLTPAAAAPAPYARAALLPATPLREGDLVRAAPGQDALPGGLSLGAVGAVTAPPPGAEADSETLHVQLLVAQERQWSYDLRALELASRLEPGRVSLEPPLPPALHVGQFVRLAPGATQVRVRWLADSPHEDDNADAADSSAAAWLRPGELGVVLWVRGRRAPVTARRIGAIEGCEYEPGALAPADAPPAPLEVGDRVIRCPEYRGPLPSRALGTQLEREHVGMVTSVSGPATARLLRVAAPDGGVRTYRESALERAQVPRQVPAPATPPNGVLLEEVHGHPLGARAAVWPLMARYGGYCDLCSGDATHSSAARCTAGCAFDVCAMCLRALMASTPDGAAVAALSDEDVSAEQLLAVAAPAAAAAAAAAPVAAAAPAGAQPPLSPAPSATAAQPRTALHELPLTRGDIVTLTDGYERYGDAADGPLRPGQRGRVTRVMAREALSVRIVLESADAALDDAEDNDARVAGMYWYYMRAAVELVPPAEPPHGRACAVPMLVALAAVRFSAARSAARVQQLASARSGGGLVPLRVVGGGASAQPGSSSRSRNTWSFIDGPEAGGAGGGAAAAAAFEQDAPASAVAALRSRIAACALHGVAPLDDEKEEEYIRAAASHTAESDAESEQAFFDEYDSDDEEEDEEEDEEDEGNANNAVRNEHGDVNEGGGRHVSTLDWPMELRVCRDALVASSMAALGAIGGDAWKRPTHVTFCATAGAPPEEGSDAGGLTREWYSVTARALMELPVICPTVRASAAQRAACFTSLFHR